MAARLRNTFGELNPNLIAIPRVLAGGEVGISILPGMGYIDMCHCQGWGFKQFILAFMIDIKDFAIE